MRQDELIRSRDITLCPTGGSPIQGISSAEDQASPEYAEPAPSRVNVKLPRASSLFGAAGGSAGPSEYRSRLLSPRIANSIRGGVRSPPKTFSKER